MLSRFAFLLALAAITVPVMADDDDMTRIKVHVTTLQGNPVDRASVVVNFVEGRSVVKLGKKMVTKWELRTNQDGMARIPAIPKGKVRVQVIAKGYQTFGEVFEVSEPEKTIQIKLNPPQPQVSAH
jgi:hypothetical protein